MLTTNENAQAATTPTSWMSTCFGRPYSSPLRPAELMAMVAKTPVRIAPVVPPTPWMPTTSSASSKPNLLLSLRAEVAQRAGDERR